MTRSNPPDYVERGGQEVWRPPYTARGANLWGFVVKASAAAVDELLQRDFVGPSRGAVNYRCVHDNVIVAFADIAELASGDPVDSKRGHLREREVSVWCIAADPRARGQLVWYLPYVFADNGLAVASGREVYGYPKQAGRFEAKYPAQLVDGGTATVRALAMRGYGAGNAAESLPMISVKRRPGGRAGTTQTVSHIVDEIATWFAGGFATAGPRAAGPGPRQSARILPLGAPLPAPETPAPPWVKGLLTEIEPTLAALEPLELIVEMAANPTLAFLKQFRDASCATKACYQAVIESRVSMLPGAKLDLLDESRFELTLEDWSSHPLATELLGASGRTKLSPLRAFHAEFGFDVQLGDEIWRAPV
jgi:hypothetical protein